MFIIDLRNDDIVKTQKQFDKFYDESIFTWEGMSCDENNLKEICRYLRLKNPVFYIFCGRQMNEVYGLKGENAYPQDLTFVSIKDYYNPIVKLQVNARWFDDIVDNNTRRNGGE